MEKRPDKYLSRREILALVGSSMLGLSPLSSTLAKVKERTPSGKTNGAGKRKIIVIGAGVSGLAAASELNKNSLFDVTVFEARNRIGGRVWTDTSTMSCPIELGASWIHGITNNPIYKIAADNKIRVVDCGYWSRSQIFASDGKELDRSKYSKATSIFQSITESAYRQQKKLSLKSDRDQSVAQAISKAMSGMDLTAEEQSLINHMIATNIENDHGIQIDQLSLKNWDKGHEFEGAQVLIPGGYDKVMQVIARELNIKLGMVVQEINYGSAGVKVLTADGGETVADAVILTVPLGVLKKGTVKFSPELPDEKLRSIEGLGMGVFDKLYLHFPNRFWSLKPTWIEYVGDDSKAGTMFFNMAKFTDNAILAAFNVGDFALKLEDKSDDDVVRESMIILRRMFGADIPAPSVTKRTSWGNDPFSYGSYSYIPVGASAADYDELAKPVADQLFFAGEACSSKNYSTVDAAFMSGVRTARLVSARLRASHFVPEGHMT